MPPEAETFVEASSELLYTNDKKCNIGKRDRFRQALIVIIL